MNKNAYIGVDVGSGSVRAGVFSSQGQCLAAGEKPIQQFHGIDDRVEQSSAEIWQAVCNSVRDAVETSAIDPQRIRSIGFDATCSLVAVGENGKGISVSSDEMSAQDIVMWMDHRAKDETDAINQTGDDALQYVGGGVSIEMELPKILWLKRRFPERYRKTWRYFDLADYLVWRATGSDVASVCTLTCKWNYLSHEQRFSLPLLNAVGLDDLVNKIPASILNVGERAGGLRPEVAQTMGIRPQTTVASGLIDAHAGALALSGAQPQGNLVLIGGTSNCHMIVSKKPIFVPGVWGPYWGAMLPRWWLNEGGQSAAGSLVEWTLRHHESWNTLQHEANQQQTSIYQILNRWVDDLKQQEPWPTRHLHVLGDHHGNRSPRANPSARGAVYGLTLESGTRSLARLYLATLQAVAYGTRHIIDSMRTEGHEISRLTLCGGATKNPLWLREYANATSCAIHLPREDNTVALGAALSGSVACGDFPSLSTAAAAMAHPGETIPIDTDRESQAFHQAKYHVYLQMYHDLERAERIFSDRFSRILDRVPPMPRSDATDPSPQASARKIRFLPPTNAT